MARNQSEAKSASELLDHKCEWCGSTEWGVIESATLSYPATVIGNSVTARPERQYIYEAEDYMLECAKCGRNEDIPGDGEVEWL